MTQPKHATSNEVGRFYQIPGVERPLISVTTVIGMTESKPFLTNWACRLALETGNIREHEAVRDAAGDRGTRFHDWAEQWGLGLKPPAPAGLEPECIGFLTAMQKLDATIEATEATVFDPVHGYAGTLDALLRMPDGRLLVCDYKTSKSLQKSVALQLAALRYAPFLLLPDGMHLPTPPIDGGCAIHVTAKGSKFVPVRTGERQIGAFRAALALAQYLIEDAKLAFRKEEA